MPLPLSERIALHRRALKRWAEDAKGVQWAFDDLGTCVGRCCWPREDVLSCRLAAHHGRLLGELLAAERRERKRAPRLADALAGGSLASLVDDVSPEALAWLWRLA